MPPKFNEIPKHCNNLYNQYLINLCNMAKRFQITINDADAIIFAYGVENTARLCGFKLTDDFEMLKNAIFASNEKKQAYIYQLNSFDKSRINNINVWCKEMYKGFGPKAPPSPPFGVVYRYYK